jgi:hypothetical protein
VNIANGGRWAVLLREPKAAGIGVFVTDMRRVPPWICLAPIIQSINSLFGQKRGTPIFAVSFGKNIQINGCLYPDGKF